MRLDARLAEQRPEYSRSTWKKRIEAGHIKVNGMIETSPKMSVTEDDQLEASEIAPIKQTVELPVLYEDDNVLVVDKPIGVLAHSKGVLNEEFTVADFVRSRTSYKHDTNRPGIIHRLDRATSGVMLLVKNESTARYIAKQFSNRTVKKQYVAVVAGIPKESEAVIDLPIGRSPSKPSTFKVDPSGKHAETRYTVLESSGTRSLVKLEPKTGRTHQLRVHMAYLGTPIIGDPVYGTTASDRMYLHAERLEVTLPGGDRRVFTAAVPVSFKAAVAS